MTRAPRMVPLGDAAVLVELADRADAEATALVGAACAALEGDGRFLEVVPAYTSVAVFYEPLDFGGHSPFAAACGVIESLLHGLAVRAPSAARSVEIPVRYGGVDGPDLDDVARHTGLDAAEVVRRHAAAEYTVSVIGFAPGFPYLAGMPPALATPRRATPRERVPAGSVGIAGEQTGIYPLETPGGWNLIGRTDTALFTPSQHPPTLLRVGDRVRFIPLA